MSPIYYILLFTLLGSPIVAIFLSAYLKIKLASSAFRLIVVFFLLHNLLFFFGYSLRGDYIDYTIFSLEYFAFCVMMFALFKTPGNSVGCFRAFGLIVVSLGILIGLLGIAFFIFLAMDFDAAKIFHFQNNNKTYETRLYTFEGATLSNTKYTFETYRRFQFLPIEHKVDKTIFYDDKTELDISDPKLKISVLDTLGGRKIIFKSTNSKTFEKMIH